jgi:spore coat protein U-like protein
MKLSLTARIAGLTSAAAMLAALVPAAANAGSVNQNVNVSASVAQNCKMTTTTNIAFGAYDPVTVSAVTNATGALSVSCTKAATGITLTLSAGGNSTHAVGPQTRAMIGATNGNFLSYDVFEDSGYATRFPVSAVAESVTGGITTPTTISLYGQIPAAAQDVAVDTYSDTLVATLNF